MIKKILSVILLFTFIVTAVPVQAQADTVETHNIGVWGNTPLTIASGGYACDSGDYTYYAGENGLYRRDLSGGSLKLSSENPSYINVINSRVYFVTGNDTVKSLSVDGSDEKTEFYEPQGLSCLYVGKDSFYYLSDNTVYRRYFTTGKSLAVYYSQETADAFLLDDDGTVTIAQKNPGFTSDPDEEATTGSNGELENIPGTGNNEYLLVDGIPENAGAGSADETREAMPSVKVGGVTLPFSDYPSGSYFSNNGKACTCHKTASCCVSAYGCNCKYMDGNYCLYAWQCYGFARLVFYRCFGFIDHQTLYGSKFRSLGTLRNGYVTANAVKTIMSGARAGAHIRVTRGHSMVFISSDKSGLWVYEANWSGKCRVGTRYITWEDFAAYAYSGINYINMPNSYPEKVSVSNAAVTVSSNVYTHPTVSSKVVSTSLAVGAKLEALCSDGLFYLCNVIGADDDIICTGYMRKSCVKLSGKIPAAENFYEYIQLTLNTDTYACSSPKLTSASRVAKYRSGSKPVALFADSDRYYIMTSAASGYISKTSATRRLSPGTYAVTTYAGLNMRTGPSTSYPVVTVFPIEHQMAVSQISGNWGKTEYNDISGWVCLDYTALADSAPKTVKSVSVAAMPSKTKYYLTSTFDQKRLVLLASFSDGTKTYIYSGYKMESYKISSVGKNKMVVQFGSVKTAFYVDCIGMPASFTGWQTTDCGKYYFISGKPAKGLTVIGGKTYLFSDDGKMCTGLCGYGSDYYYLNTDGTVRTGLVKVGKAYYYFNSDGKMLKLDWQTVNGNRYYFAANGKAVTGLVTIESATYFFDENGIMRTGIVKVGNSYYCFLSDGKMFNSGFRTENGVCFYFGTDGKAYTGLVSIDGQTYYFDSSAAMQTGFVKIGKSVYYFTKNGTAHCSGWLKTADMFCYAGADGKLYTGLKKIDGCWYGFNSSGVMQTGLIKFGSYYFYFDTDGKMLLSRWKTIDSKRYYFAANGRAATGLTVIDGSQYGFNSLGVMCTGLVMGKSGVYYFGTDGKAVSGLRTVNGKQYFFDEHGKATTGFATINGKLYFFAANGTSVTGFVKLDGRVYYLTSTRTLLKGFKKISGKYYYFNSGYVMQTGFVKIGSRRYYFLSNGVMHTGWLRLGTSYYYLKTNGVMCANEFEKIGAAVYYFSAAGVRQIGFKKIDGKLYLFNSHGVRMENRTVTIKTVNYTFNAYGVCTHINGKKVDYTTK